MPKPLCFMVMPYGRRVTNLEPGAGPAEVDFNRLWDAVYAPVLEQLGYQPVRADQDTGALIVTEMLQRLYFADLVLADMSLPNGNVYYEVGIRHAARTAGCVLLAAAWAKPLFDVAQLRTLRFPLADGLVGDAAAQAAREAIARLLPNLVDGSSPMTGAIAGYPDRADPQAAAGMRDQMVALAAFQADVRAVRAAPAAQRMARALALADANAKPPVLGAVALALVKLMRDCSSTAEHHTQVLAFIDTLPEPLRAMADIAEQRAMAQSSIGNDVESVAGLEALVAQFGATPERLGLLGGRWKRVMRSRGRQGDAAGAKQALNEAIQAYERGMQLDLNDYYCSSNLPRLYRQRGRASDLRAADATLQLVMAACGRALRRGITDEWLRPTLLTAAFDAADADKAEEIADQVEDEGLPAWKLSSVRDDLLASVELVADAGLKVRLAAVLARFGV